jgi:hypothetical protein
VIDAQQGDHAEDATPAEALAAEVEVAAEAGATASDGA